MRSVIDSRTIGRFVFFKNKKKEHSLDGIEITPGIHTFPSTGYDRNENRTDRKVERKRVSQREPRIS